MGVKTCLSTLIDEDLSVYILTKTVCFVRIPCLKENAKTVWHIRALATMKPENGTIYSQVIKDLLQWKRESNQDWKKLIKSMQTVAERRQHREDHTFRFDRNNKEVFEIRANKGLYRVMAFYLHPTVERNDPIIVCATTHSKGSGHSEHAQTNAFERCEEIRRRTSTMFQ